MCQIGKKTCCVASIVGDLSAISKKETKIGFSTGNNRKKVRSVRFLSDELCLLIRKTSATFTLVEVLQYYTWVNSADLCWVFSRPKVSWRVFNYDNTWMYKNPALVPSLGVYLPSPPQHLRVYDYQHLKIKSIMLHSSLLINLSLILTPYNLSVP